MTHTLPTLLTFALADGSTTETVEVERNIGAMVSMLTVAVQELDARLDKIEKPKP